MPDEQDELGVILRHAQTRAAWAGASEIDTQHLLTAILCRRESPFIQHLSKSIELPHSLCIKYASPPIQFSLRCKMSITLAAQKCYLIWRHKSIQDAHLLLALIDEDTLDDSCIKYIELWKIDLYDLRRRTEIYLKLLPAERLEDKPSIPNSAPAPGSITSSVGSRVGPEYDGQTPEVKRPDCKQELTDWFDPDALKLIRKAQLNSPNYSIGVDALVSAMLLHSDSIAGKVMLSLGLRTVSRDARSESPNETEVEKQLFSNDVLKILEYALTEARQMGAKKLDSGHLLVAIARAIVDEEIRSNFDANTSFSDIAVFRDQVLAIRRTFERSRERDFANDHPESIMPPPEPTPFRVIDPVQALKLPESFSPIPCGRVVSSILSLAVAEREYAGHLRLNYAHIALGLISESEKTHRIEAFDRRAELQRLSSLLEILATRINEFSFVDQGQDVLQIAWNIAQQFHSNKVEFNHITLAVILFGGHDFASVWNESSSTKLPVLQRQLESCSVRLAAQNNSLLPDFFLDEDKLRQITRGIELSEHKIRSAISDLDDISQFLSYTSKTMVALAGAYTREYHRHAIDVEMLIMALGTSNTSNAWKALKACGLVLRQNDPEILKRGKSRRASKLQLAPNAQSIMHGAIELAHSEKKDLVAPEHILQAIINECNGYSQLALQIFDLDALELDEVLREIMNDNP